MNTSHLPTLKGREFSRKGILRLLTAAPARARKYKKVDFRYPGDGDKMDNLTAFGLFAVTAMLVTYALEDRSAWFILAFAGACALASVYGFLQGAWPFGLVEGIWAVVAARRWSLKGRG
jgi:hypothetical protein